MTREFVSGAVKGCMALAHQTMIQNGPGPMTRENKNGAGLAGCGRKVRRSAAVYGASTVSAGIRHVIGQFE